MMVLKKMTIRCSIRCAFVVAASLLLSGCGSIEVKGNMATRMSAAVAQRKKASLAGWEEKKSARSTALQSAAARTALLLMGFDHVKVKPVVRTAGHIRFAVSMKVTRQCDMSSAVPVSSDGYFLTGAHCVSGEGPLTVVAFTKDFRVVQSSARIVWMGDPKSNRADLALIHASLQPAGYYRLADVPTLAPSEPVALTGWSSTPQTAMAAGRIGKVSKLHHDKSGFAWREVRHDVPFAMGDSGGPLIAQDGRLVGINTEMEFGFVAALRVLFGGTSFTDRPLAGYQGKAFAPDREWLERMMEADRRAGR